MKAMLGFSKVWFKNDYSIRSRKQPPSNAPLNAKIPMHFFDISRFPPLKGMTDVILIGLK